MPLYCPLRVGNDDANVSFCQADTCQWFNLPERECCIKMVCDVLVNFDRVYMQFTPKGKRPMNKPLKNVPDDD